MVKVPPSVSDWMSKIGSKGGKRSVETRSKDKRKMSEQARKAVNARWAKAKRKKKAQ